jgi:hypothetical protein
MGFLETATRVRVLRRISEKSQLHATNRAGPTWTLPTSRLRLCALGFRMCPFALRPSTAREKNIREVECQAFSLCSFSFKYPCGSEKLRDSDHKVLCRHINLLCSSPRAICFIATLAVVLCQDCFVPALTLIHNFVPLLLNHNSYSNYHIIPST